MKNNIMRLLLAACAFSSLIVPAYAANVDPAEPAPESEAVVATQTEGDKTITPRGDSYWSVLYNGVHIRSGPGTSYASYGMLQKGDTVLWESYNQTNTPYANGHYWMKVYVYSGANKDVEGWVAADYLEKFI